MTKNKFYIQILSITALLCFSTNPALAWQGYDYQDQTTIDISGGNLVREGLVIEFYDTKSDSFHNGKILIMEETSSGSTTLKIQDLTTDKERTFVMME